MKINKASCLVVAWVLVCGSAALAVDFVDVGNTGSEAGHGMSSWGPIEPANSGGGYGGIDDCRAIWSDLAGDNSRSARIDLNFGNASEGLYFRHLEGIGDDGFEVYVDGNWAYTHTENTSTERWVVSFCFPNESGGPKTVEFVATGDPWSGWATYGQVCFAEVWVGTEQPVPADESAWGRVKALYR